MTREPQGLRDYGSDIRTNYDQTVDRIYGEDESISVDSFDQESHGRDVVALLVMQWVLEWIVGYLDDAEISTEGLTADLKTIKDTNAGLREELGDQYEHALRERFKTLYQSYPYTVVDIFGFEPVPLETTNDIDRRHEMQILFDELSLDQSEVAEGI